MQSYAFIIILLLIYEYRSKSSLDISAKNLYVITMYFFGRITLLFANNCTMEFSTMMMNSTMEFHGMEFYHGIFTRFFF